jgi:hypothetical protein
MDGGTTSLRIIAQGVINSLFAKRFIRCAPAVHDVVEEERYRFAIHLDDCEVPLIKVALEPEEFFAEGVRRTVLRRLATRDRAAHE